MERRPRTARWLTALALAGGVVAAMPARVNADATPVPPSGKALYERYCASCHGTSGKGDGPVASALAVPPTNLTLLAQTRGKLDEQHLMAVIDGRRLVAAHGPREMPVWGAVFDQELAGQPYRGYLILLRAQVLADYLSTIQAR